MASLSKKDKITFSILKWIFNAIQKEQRVERDEQLDQIKRNIDIVQMLGFETIDEVQAELYDKVTQSHGFFNWEEFLDFFLVHSSTKEE